ncbi:hypothetical protein ACX818_001405 [Acinetobacter baumannii]
MAINKNAQDENPEQHHLGISTAHLERIMKGPKHKMPSNMYRRQRRLWANQIARQISSVQPMDSNLYKDLMDAFKPKNIS